MLQADRDQMRAEMLQDQLQRNCKEYDPHCVINDMDREIQKFNNLLENIMDELEQYGHVYTKEQSLELLKRHIT